MSCRRLLAASLLFGLASPAWAGAPFLTDDPVPTDLHRWEIDLFSTAEGRRSDLDGAIGVDLNYGAADNLQLTATIPLALSHERESNWRAGTSDLELAFKYRFIHDERTGISVATFPRVILPTSSLEHGGKTRLLLPVWAQKDFAGGTSLFGGAAYLINPGAGNRNFWQVGAAVTHDVNDRLTLGGELVRQGRDSNEGSPQTSAGAAAIVKLSKNRSLLLSAGPTWSAHRTSYHGYAGIAFFF